VCVHIIPVDAKPDRSARRFTTRLQPGARRSILSIADQHIILIRTPNYYLNQKLVSKIVSKPVSKIVSKLVSKMFLCGGIN
jgi:hypothetical protein